MRGKLKTLLIWAGILAGLVYLYQSHIKPEPASRVSFDTFRRQAAAGQIAEVWINGNEITVRPTGHRDRYAALGVVDEDLERTLSERGAVIRRGQEPDSSFYFMVVVAAVAGLLVFFYLVRKIRAGGGDMGSIFSLRKSRARLVSDPGGATFADVGGCEEAKELLGDVIDFLKSPQRWTRAGARLPRGVLLEGPPGCGKTLLARAVAGETSARFYCVSACEFVELFVGVGAARVRDMFETALKSAPAVIFIDELDAVGRVRGSGIGYGHNEREQTLNQLLVCLDGFHANDRVVVIAATNRPDILDQALLRPGRFDRRIRLPELSAQARLEVLRIHTRNKRLAADVALERWAEHTPGLNGAQLESLVNEAALSAVRRARGGDGAEAVIQPDDFEQAVRPRATQPRLFDKLDSVLIESASQLAEPTGKAVVRLALCDGKQIAGEVLWVDATFIKVRDPATGTETVVAKSQVCRLEALEGTGLDGREDLMIDGWAGRTPGLDSSN